MADLSPYEMRVLRHMVAREDQDLICGAAMWVAMENLEGRGLVRGSAKLGGIVAYEATKAGRALVRASDDELTEAKNG